jgi:hypothetical protein
MIASFIYNCLMMLFTDLSAILIFFFCFWAAISLWIPFYCTMMCQISYSLNQISFYNYASRIITKSVLKYTIQPEALKNLLQISINVQMVKMFQKFNLKI